MPRVLRIPLAGTGSPAAPVASNPVMPLTHARAKSPLRGVRYAQSGRCCLDRRTNVTPLGALDGWLDRRDDQLGRDAPGADAGVVWKTAVGHGAR